MSESQTRAPGRFIPFIWGLVVAALLVPVVLNVYDHVTGQKSAVPDEKSAILQLLAQKFSGAGYFQAEGSGQATATSAGKVYLGVAVARSQVPRIAAARHLTEDDTMQLTKIIERMTEPSPSRLVGDERVNVLLLNLALDAQK